MKKIDQLLEKQDKLLEEFGILFRSFSKRITN